MALVLLLAALQVTAAESATPHTLEEAFAILNATLSADQRDTFQRKPEEQAVQDEHFGLGLMIRNAWLRSQDRTLAKGLREVGAGSLDDASSMILTSYWRHLNGRPIELEKQGACYRRWWQEQMRLDAEAKARGELIGSSPSFDCRGA